MKKRGAEWWLTLGALSLIAAIDAIRTVVVEIPPGINVAIVAAYAIARTAVTYCAKPPEDDEDEE